MRGFHRILSATLIALGVAVFLWGGSRHPATGADLGPLGSTEYLGVFAAHVAGIADWRTIHAAILAGPILWALGGIGLARELGRSGAPDYAVTGAAALGMGAVAATSAWAADAASMSQEAPASARGARRGRIR